MQFNGQPFTVVGVAPKDGRQPIGAEPGVGADAAVVGHGDLQADVGVEPVGDPFGILAVGEADIGMGAVAEWLGRRLPAAA